MSDILWQKFVHSGNDHIIYTELDTNKSFIETV